MHDSMMIAVVLSIAKVSGMRIATPFAPPRPGSTPMITPRMTPTNIMARLNGVSAMPKPWMRELISATGAPLIQPEPGFQQSLGQRNLEPNLEHEKERDAYADRHHHRTEPRVAAEPAHETADEDRGRDVDAKRRHEPRAADQDDVDHRWHEHPHHLLERPAGDESFGRLLVIGERAEKHRGGR